MGGVHLLLEQLKPERVVIAVEDNKPEAIKILERIAEKDDEKNRIRIMPLRARYPQGAEKMMPRGERCRPGGFPLTSGAW